MLGLQFHSVIASVTAVSARATSISSCPSPMASLKIAVIFLKSLVRNLAEAVRGELKLRYFIPHEQLPSGAGGDDLICFEVR